MADGLTFTIKIDDKELQKRFERWDKGVKQAVIKSLNQSALLVQNDAKSNAPVLRGKLRNSITSQLNKNDYSAKIGTDLIYARIHEFGGTIVPKKAKFLVFKIDGKTIRTKKVIIKPYRGIGYLRPALKKNIKKILDYFKENLTKLLK